MTAPSQLPGFDASLRLLVERERYSHTDIALMFGVSRERVRQWCEKRGIVYLEHTARGLQAIRVWDDGANRFQPVARGAITRQREQAATSLRMARRAHQQAVRRAESQASILEAVLSLRARLHRDPTWNEMWIAIGGDADARYFASAPRVLGRWDSRWNVSIRAKLIDFRKKTGIVARSVGGRGHVTGAHRPRNDCSKCGGPLHACRSGRRACRPCAAKRRRELYAVATRKASLASSGGAS